MDERPLTLVMALRAAMWDHQWSTGDPELVSDNYTRHTFAEVIADGPLSDLSILVQISLVRSSSQSYSLTGMTLPTRSSTNWLTHWRPPMDEQPTPVLSIG